MAAVPPPAAALPPAAAQQPGAVRNPPIVEAINAVRQCSTTQLLIIFGSVSVVCLAVLFSAWMGVKTETPWMTTVSVAHEKVTTTTSSGSGASGSKFNITCASYGGSAGVGIRVQLQPPAAGKPSTWLHFLPDQEPSLCKSFEHQPPEARLRPDGGLELLLDSRTGSALLLGQPLEQALANIRWAQWELAATTAANTYRRFELAEKRLEDLELQQHSLMPAVKRLEQRLQTVENLLQKLQDQVLKAGSPSGTVVAFVGEKIPDGWLLCDGTEYPIEKYPRLFEAIGFSHGFSKPKHFYLPDYRGMFHRGRDRGKGIDRDSKSRQASGVNGATGDQLGSRQDHQFGRHNHRQDGKVDAPPDDDEPGMVTRTTTEKIPAVDWDKTPVNKPVGAVSIYGKVVSIPAAGGAETRPVNMNVDYIIKI